MLIQYTKIVKLLPARLQKKLSNEILVKAVSKNKAKELNLRFFKKNYPANVLSFKYGPDYGEILVCSEVVKKEAREQRNSYKYQMTWMAVHGIIHLTELHHEDSKKTARRAEKLERRILHKLFS